MNKSDKICAYEVTNIDGCWPEEGLESVPCCPICGNSGRKLLHGGLRDRIFSCAPGEWNLFSCTDCGAGYVDPRPSLETIGKAYSSYYTHGSAGGVESPPRSRWRKYRTAQRNTYLNERYGYALKPTTAFGSLWLSSERRQRFDKYVCFLPFPGKGARVLDVGCGNGRLLMQLRSVGWEVCGVEPDPKSAAQAVEANLDVRVGRLEDAYPESHFDAITMNHVIEHLHEPIQTLKSCARLLKPRGRICVLTPNLAGSGHQIFGSDWFALDAPRHLVLFTPGSLRRALEISGFETGSSMQVLPTSPAIHRSTNWMRRSMQLRHGINPMKNEPRLALKLCLKAMWLAWRANRRSRVDPEQAEELIVVARRPE